MPNDVALGNAGNDAVFGGLGNDWVFGGLDKDLVYGDAGDDTLTGGAGADRFVMGGTGGGTDTVTDFQFTQGDRIEIAGGVTYAVANESSGVIVTFSTGDRLRLTGLTSAQVTGAWFVG